MTSPITLTPIGTVHSPIREPLDEVFGGLTARIELDPARFTPESLKGLDEFSHVEILFYFHQLDESDPYRDLLVSTYEEWDKAESIIKLAEQVSGEIVFPSINELRYAGRRISEALSCISRGDDHEKTIRPR